jgi:hypothetical protein
MNALPCFASTLRAFGGAAYDQVARLDPKVVISVDRIEVELPSANPRDPETWRTAVLSDEQVRRAYELLAERCADEFNAICTRIATGKLA